MFKKIIYKDKYDEIIEQFNSLIYNDVDYKYVKLDYNGWALCLEEIKDNDDYSIIKYGNLSYFVHFGLNYNSDKIELVKLFLTDDSADEKYTDDYYIINSYYDDVLKNKEIIKVNKEEYGKQFNNNFTFKSPFISCDFAYYKNNLVVLTRDDILEFNYLICIGNNSKDNLNAIVNNIKQKQKKDVCTHFFDQKFFDKVIYEIKMNQFKKEDNSIILMKLYELLIDNNFKELMKYINPNCRYTSPYTYGFEGLNYLKQLFDNFDIKEIINNQMKIVSNKVYIMYKYKDSANKVHNKVITIAIDFNNTIICFEEEPVFLYGLKDIEN